jgi:uncharacterized protein YdaU (DUF1376 family)
MAKDPAFLFYPNDWIGGTMGMTFEEKGAYMELLMMQFNRGHMTKHMMAQVVGQMLDKLLDKFIKDSNGLYYNDRLEQEQIRRKSFVVSRLNNKKGINGHTKKVGHMTSHMENENINENVIKDSSVLEQKKEEVERIFLQQGGTKEMALAFFNRYEAVDWKIRGTPIKNFTPLIGTFITNWKQNTNGKQFNQTGNKQHALTYDKP